jgi:hypothetical protein
MGIFKKEKRSAEIVLNSAFFEKLYSVIDQLPGDGIEDDRIAYSGRDSRQFLNVVGESFCQEDLRRNFKPDKWRYGLLVPEQENRFDSNAIAIYLISPDEESDDGEYGVYRVGHLTKELAKSLSGKIANLLVRSGTVIPVLAMVKEEANRENLAVVAYAMTDRIQF